MTDTDSLIGHVIDRKYKLLRKVGSGGYGVVYQAENLTLHRMQAIKILSEALTADPEARRRFLREARILATLEHMHIIHLDDFGTDRQQAYLVMPYISGGTLHNVLQAHPVMRLVQIVNYMENMCSALDYAHKKGVVHLDLKPQNLLVHEDGRLILADFGLAHLLEGNALQGAISLALGTRPYMAPEHWSGKPDKRSDLYSLGLILYQLLVGQLPPPGYAFRGEPPPLPSRERKDLPQAIDAVVVKALAAKPENRYQTAQGLLMAVRNAFSKNKTDPMPASSPRAAKKMQPQAGQAPQASPQQSAQAKRDPSRAPVQQALSQPKSVNRAAGGKQPLAVPHSQGSAHRAAHANPVQHTPARFMQRRPNLHTRNDAHIQESTVSFRQAAHILATGIAQFLRSRRITTYCIILIVLGILCILLLSMATGNAHFSLPSSLQPLPVARFPLKSTPVWPLGVVPMAG